MLVDTFSRRHALNSVVMKEQVGFWGHLALGYLQID